MDIPICSKGTITCMGMINSLFKIMLPSAAAAAKSLQSCLTLCDPIDSSPPGSPVPGILQAILEWAAIPSLQGIFPTKGLNPNLLCLLHYSQNLYR